jgi:cytochrome oxidase assembly protein ShyY1
MSAELETAAPTEESKQSNTLQVITWFSVGMAVAAVGIFVGREMRSRYKFRRRTPYDFYSQAEYQAGEYGVGV